MADKQTMDAAYTAMCAAGFEPDEVAEGLKYAQQFFIAQLPIGTKAVAGAMMAYQFAKLMKLCEGTLIPAALDALVKAVD